MKKLPFILIALLSTTACVDFDDATKAVTVSIQLTMPQALQSHQDEGLQGRQVVMSIGNASLSALTDAQGVATFEALTPDVYDISCSWQLTADEYHRLSGDPQVVSGATVSGALNARLITNDETIALTTQLSVNRDILIGKVYYAGSKDLNNRTYMAGKYVELYNQSDDSTDVSGLYIALTEAESTQAYTLENLHQAFADSVILLKQVFRIPAEQPCILKPGGTLLVVNSATDHTPNNILESDLTHADFEAKDTQGRTQNNPATPALQLVYTMYPSVSNMNLVQSGPCGVVIFRTDSDVSTWGKTYAYGKSSGNQWILAPKRLIIDGIDILRLTNKTPAVDVGTKRLYTDIDAGYTNINAISGWNGEVVYRRTAGYSSQGHPILMDTNNSSNDLKVSNTIKPRQYDE